jgi:ribosomal protein L13E
MADTVHVEAARIPDRDRLLAELREAGLDARPDGEVGIEVPMRNASSDVADEVFAQAEHVIISIGAPFVPLKHEGVIYIRPPVS